MQQRSRCDVYLQKENMLYISPPYLHTSQSADAGSIVIRFYRASGLRGCSLFNATVGCSGSNRVSIAIRGGIWSQKMVRKPYNIPMRFTARNDYAFKKLFGTEENKDIMIEFISLVTLLSQDDFDDVRIENSEQIPQFYNQKAGRLDIKIRLSDGRKIDVEMSFPDRHPCLSGNTSFAIRQNIASAGKHRRPWRSRYGKRPLPIKVKN